MAETAPALEVLTLGRSSVDLYGQQIGGRLEDMTSFAKAVGGSPTNIAVGCARLGLRAGLLSRVGDEHMGRFIREQLQREGVDTRGLSTDPERLTSIVILGVRDSSTFPLLFYRENCADLALGPEAIDPEFVAAAGALVITGTHFSTALTAAGARKALAAARGAGRRTALDIDYRPNLWGLAGHQAGEERFIESGNVTGHIQEFLREFDLIVGTEEEVHIAGGSTDTRAALRRIRELAPTATLVLKRGPMGCVVFPAAIPDDLDAGIRGAGFPVEVYNVLGAGDAFMAGFLRGWLRGEPLETCSTYANACGAFAVSRLLCAPEYPTWPELQHFLRHGASERALRRDAALAHIHRATTRRPQAPSVSAFAIDHRAQLLAIAEQVGADPARIGKFKELAVAATLEVAAGRPGFGMLLDERLGREALFAADRAGLWLARPVELPGSRPLAFEQGRDLAAHLVEWPITHTVKCLCFTHPGDEPALIAAQDETLLTLQEACLATGHEFLVEIIASKAGPLAEDTTAAVLRRLYGLGLRPEWWKLEPQPAASWQAVSAAIAEHDPWCRGVLMLGLEGSEAALAVALETAARACPQLRGFAIGRTLFAAAAEAWLAGRMTDAEAVADMAARFARFATLWQDIGRARAA